MTKKTFPDYVWFTLLTIMISIRGWSRISIKYYSDGFIITKCFIAIALFCPIWYKKYTSNWRIEILANFVMAHMKMTKLINCHDLGSKCNVAHENVSKQTALCSYEVKVPRKGRWAFHIVSRDIASIFRYLKRPRTFLTNKSLYRKHTP